MKPTFVHLYSMGHAVTVLIARSLILKEYKHTHTVKIHMLSNLRHGLYLSTFTQRRFLQPQLDFKVYLLNCIHLFMSIFSKSRCY